MSKRDFYDRGNIYLSGGMEHAIDNGAGWREQTSKVLQDLAYYPIDIAALDKEYRKYHGNIDASHDGSDQQIWKKKANIRKHFVQTDTKLIVNNSDAVILYYDSSVRRGAGTIAEAQIAYMHDIPLFIVCDWEDWESELPEWLHAISTRVFTSFDELYTYLEELPYGVLKHDQYGNHRSDNYYLCSLSGEPFQKSKTHFVSNVSPLYSNQCVEIVKGVHEIQQDRYQFFVDVMNEKY